MLSSVRRAALAAVVAVPVGFGLAAPASAAPVPSPAATTAAGAAGPARVIINSRLTPTSPGHVVFVPNHTTGPVVSKQACNQTHFTFAVANDTRVTQQFLYQNKKFGPPIPPSTPQTTHYLYGCFYSAGTGVIGVANHHLAKLTVTS